MEPMLTSSLEMDTNHQFRRQPNRCSVVWCPISSGGCPLGSCAPALLPRLLQPLPLNGCLAEGAGYQTMGHLFVWLSMKASLFKPLCWRWKVKQFSVHFFPILTQINPLFSFTFLKDFLYHAAVFVFYFGTFLLQAATTSLHAHPIKLSTRLPANSTTALHYERLLSEHEYNLSIAAAVSIKYLQSDLLHHLREHCF